MHVWRVTNNVILGWHKILKQFNIFKLLILQEKQCYLICIKITLKFVVKYKITPIKLIPATSLCIYIYVHACLVLINLFIDHWFVVDNYVLYT